MGEHIHIGPFQIRALLDRGGMGEVWEGRHGRTGVEIVVKTIARAALGEARYRDAFRAEAEAIARLDHPGVVAIHDVGALERDVSMRAVGQELVLEAGTSYIAMERVPGRSLGQWSLPLGAAELRAALEQLLDALAYVHARGVLHRDIKPPNVLARRGSELDGGLRAVLIDFGIARLTWGEHRDHSLQGGTPGYMAPEQFAGSLEAQGPWTDLFALAHLAFELATGHNLMNLSDQPAWSLEPRVNDQARRVLEACGWSQALMRWLEIALSVAPQDRFEHAVDALLALPEVDALSVGPGAASAEAAPVPALTAPGTHTALSTLACLDRIFPATERGLGEPTSAPMDAPGRPGPRPVPPDWRPEPAPSSSRLPGVGLGLYRLRDVPVVGREPERDQLWAALARADRRARLELAAMSGPLGVGKSRLARWLCERAHELGVAGHLAASLDRDQPPLQGVFDALSLQLGLARRERFEVVVERIERYLPGDAGGARQLARALAPPAGDRPLRRAERFAAAASALVALAARRPLIVWIDDLHHDPAAAAWVAWWADQRGLAAHPILVIATSQSDHPDPEALGWPERATHLHLDPLAGDHQAALIEHLLELEPDTLAQVLGRTGGNPLFALQLVGDWVRRGLLVVDGQRFALPEGADVGLPDDLYALFTDRLADLLEAAPDRLAGAAQRALLLVGLLGQAPDLEVWRAACAHAGAGAATDWLLDELARRGLAGRERGRLALRHELLREALARQASRREERAQLELACAHALALVHGEDARWARAIASHLRAAGAFEQALAPLHIAARHLARSGDLQAAQACLVEYDEALEALGPEAAPGARARRWLVEAELRRFQWRFEECRERGAQALVRARELADPELELLAEGALARADFWQGRLASAAEHAARALKLARAGQDPEVLAEHLRTAGNIAIDRGELDTAQDHFEEAIALWERLERPVQRAMGLEALASICRQRAQIERGLELIEAALQVYGQYGQRYSEANATNTAGELYRYAGQWARAEQAYEQAIARYRAVGSRDEVVAWLGLAMNLVQSGQPGRALEVSQRTRETLERWQVEGFLCFALATQLAAHAQRADAPRFDDVHAQLVADLEGTELGDVDIATMAGLAADAWRDQGDEARAGRAQAIAREHGVG